MIIYSSKIPKLFGSEGLTFLWFIFICHSEKNCSEWLLKHEQLHVKQQKDWWYIPYMFVYMWDYIVGRCKGMSHREAYLNIRFEKEAYALYGPNG
jgi:hypothetical protein